MNRPLSAVTSAVLLAGVLVGPVSAAKPTMQVSVTGPTSGCSGIVVSASWARPKHGQAVLTLYLRDNNASGQKYVQFAVSPTATSGSATFTIDASPGFTGSLFGIAYLNRGLDDPRKPGELLLTGDSRLSPVAAPDCNVISST
jgi:hypothetical protein